MCQVVPRDALNAVCHWSFGCCHLICPVTCLRQTGPVKPPGTSLAVCTASRSFQQLHRIGDLQEADSFDQFRGLFSINCDRVPLGIMSRGVQRSQIPEMISLVTGNCHLCISPYQVNGLVIHCRCLDRVYTGAGSHRSLFETVHRKNSL